MAQSLEKRSSKSRDESLNLWYAYNKVLYREFSRNPFPILNFDEDEAVLDEKMFRAAAGMGLTERNAEEKFYTAELRHNDGTGGPSLPWKVRRLFKKLSKAGL